MTNDTRTLLWALTQAVATVVLAAAAMLAVLTVLGLWRWSA